MNTQKVLTRQEEYFILMVIENDLNAVKKLVKNKVDWTVSEFWGLRVAAQKGHHSILLFLLGLEPNREQLANSSILAWTASANQKESLEILIQDGDYYKNDNMAVQWASCNSRQEIIELLLNYCNDFSYLFLGAVKKRRYDIVQFLLDNGLDQYDQFFEISFRTAVHLSDKKMADMLINNTSIALKNFSEKVLKDYEQL